MSAELATIERASGSSLALSPISDVQGAKARLHELQQFVQSVMVKGHDYGEIPGTNKPTLLKPGAEKLLELYGLAAAFEVTHRTEDWERGFWHYEVRCTVLSRRSGDVIGGGVGSCNSMEARYRWRVEWNNNDAHHPPAGEDWKLVRQKQGRTSWKRRTENEDRWDLPNTILKMAKKRSLVDGALSVTRSSGLFTQDVEDLPSSLLERDETGPESPPKGSTKADPTGVHSNAARPEESTPPAATTPTPATAAAPTPIGTNGPSRRAPSAPPANAAPAAAPAKPDAKALWNVLLAVAEEKGYAKSDMPEWAKNHIQAVFGKASLGDLTAQEWDALIGEVKQAPGAADAGTGAA